MAPMPRIIVFDHDGAYVRDLAESEVIGLTTVAEVGGERSMTITTTRQLDKGARILHKDRLGTWHEYVVESATSVHETMGTPIHTYWCPWSLMHDLGGTFVTGMPGTGGTPAPAAEALEAALAGTARWSVGTVDVTTTGSASFWRMSGWEALQELVKVWGGEVRADIDVGSTGVTSRRVSLLNHVGSSTPTRRFDYGYDVTGITRTVEDTLWTARVIPLGAASSSGSGYGRKIDISSVNGGTLWLQNDATADAVRVPDGGGGWEYPVQVVENPDAQTPAGLKAWALAHLEDWTTPKVSYEVGVVAFDESGDLIDIAMGDEVIVVDTAFVVDGDALRLSARVLRIEEDLIVPTNSTLVISNIRDTLGDTLGDLSSATASNTAKVDDLIVTLGTMVSDSASGVSVAHNTATALASVTLPAGTWVIEGNVGFARNATGRRIIDLSNGSGNVTAAVIAQTGAEVPAVNGGMTALHTGWMTKRTAQTTIYLNAYQDSGAALSVTGYLRAMRIQ